MEAALTPLDRDQVKRFHTLVERRKKTYSAAVVRIAIVRYPGQTEWKNSLTVVKFNHKSQSEEKDETFRYDNCILAKRSLSTDGLSEFVNQIVNSGKLILGDVYPIKVQGHFSAIMLQDYQQSNDEIFRLEWPADRLVFEPGEKGGYPVEPFASIDAPLFPDPYTVLRVWTGVDVSRYSQFIGSIVLLLPDYSAKIEDLSLTSETLSIKVNTLETSFDQLAGKLYAEKLGLGMPVQKDIILDGGSETVSLGFTPDWWQFYLLSKQTGRILDYRKVHAAWTSLPAGVHIEVGSADLEEIIKRGENEQVEFKRDLSNREDFLESVTAFANTVGGSILVGVDDNGKVVGNYEKKFEERVQSMVSDNCEPPPKIRIEKNEIQSRAVYAVLVPEGNEKPYNLRHQGFYVRAGSTDRLASRIEMDQMYGQSKMPSLGIAVP